MNDRDGSASECTLMNNGVTSEGWKTRTITNEWQKSRWESLNSFSSSSTCCQSFFYFVQMYLLFFFLLLVVNEFSFFISPDDIVRPCCVSLFSSILFLVNCFASSSFSSAFQRPPKNAPCCSFHQNLTFGNFHRSNWKCSFLTEAVNAMHHFSKKILHFHKCQIFVSCETPCFHGRSFLLGSW